MTNIEQFHNEMDLQQRKTHADRVAYAALALVQPLYKGVKFAIEKPLRSRCDRPTIYEIDGVDGRYIGIESVCQKLFDLGVKDVERTTMKSAIGANRPIAGYVIRAVGKKVGKRVAAWS